MADARDLGQHPPTGVARRRCPSTWLLVASLGFLAFDLTIAWIDRGAIPPDLSPFYIMAMVHIRALIRVLGAGVLALLLTRANRGRLFRAVGGFGQPASARGRSGRCGGSAAAIFPPPQLGFDGRLAAIAALITPATASGWLRCLGRPVSWAEVESSVTLAASRFCGLPWSALEPRHLAASRSTPEEAAELSAATVPAELGGVDAFIRRGRNQQVWRR